MLPTSEKIEAFPEGPAGQPDASPAASGLCGNLSGYPAQQRSACPEYSRRAARHLLPGDFVVWTRPSSGLQRLCRGGARCPGDGRGRSASCPTTEECDKRRTLRSPSVKSGGWAGPAHSLTSPAGSIIKYRIQNSLTGNGGVGDVWARGTCVQVTHPPSSQ